MVIIMNDVSLEGERVVAGRWWNGVRVEVVKSKNVCTPAQHNMLLPAPWQSTVLYGDDRYTAACK